jgi:DNA-binding beta-propeller fold protein YncE
MSRSKILSAAACLMHLLGSSQPASAQGAFVNFETPQTHPIETFDFGPKTYVAVCNTPANTLEVYRAGNSLPFIAKVPVGLGPSSVRWNPSNQKLYVTNFDGDSVSRVGVLASGTSIVLVLEETSSIDSVSEIRIGDEPSDIAFGTVETGEGSEERAVITLSSESSIQWLDPDTLSPFGDPEPLVVPGSTLMVVRSPRYLEWLPDGRQFFANLSNSMRVGTAFDYDVAGLQVDMTGATSDQRLFGLGTTIHALAATEANDLLFVVGTRAQNEEGIGEASVARLKTGFVQSWLWVVDISGTTPALHAEADPLDTTPFAVLPSINLNRDYSQTALKAIPTSQAMSQPTGIALIEDEGAVTGIVITGFHSDRIAVLRPNASIVRGYDFSYLDLVPESGTPGTAYSIVGPRGVVYSPTVERAFVNGRLDNSLIGFDPFNLSLNLKKALATDPTPTAIQKGREFLYSSRFSINDLNPLAPVGGFVSCASCHVDGRTDNLAWNLGVGEFPEHESDADELDPFLFDPTQDLFDDFLQNFPAPGGWIALFAFPIDKGPMVTQTLQGLVNYELNEGFQHVATNAPYYWRGARSFSDFNKAFVNLQGMDEAPSTTEMEDFEAFINTIRHPPNPEQPLDRVPTSTALQGMELFHETEQLLGTGDFDRACVDCHSLPDGSTNTLTMQFQVATTLPPGGFQFQPMETPGLRNIAGRERVKHMDFGAYSSTVDYIKSYETLFHHGNPASTSEFPLQSSWSINNFVHNNQTFAPLDGGGQEAAVTEFVRQFDTGTAPAGGDAFTVDPSQQAFSIEQGLFLEGQVKEGNIGLAAITRSPSGVIAGYWYNITNSNPSAAGVYTPVVGATSTLTSEQMFLLAVTGQHTVILQATSLGADRLVANLGAGPPTIVTGPAASNIDLWPMAPNVAYQGVAGFDVTDYITGSPPTIHASWKSSIWTQRVLQHAVASLDLYGVIDVDQVPPRRFRVTGDDIRAGAKMILRRANGAPASNPEPTLEMELYPTKYAAGGKRIWETYVELDAIQTFALLCGGGNAPGVANVLSRNYTGPTTDDATIAALGELDPVSWNRFQVVIENEGGIQSSPSEWQPLEVQNHRGNP